jgi:hypothetical protein
VHYMTRMDDTITETDVEGTIFDPEHMAALQAALMTGLWFWLDWEIALMYRDWPGRVSEWTS